MSEYESIEGVRALQYWNIRIKIRSLIKIPMGRFKKLAPSLANHGFSLYCHNDHVTVITSSANQPGRTSVQVSGSQA